MCSAVTAPPQRFIPHFPHHHLQMRSSDITKRLEEMGGASQKVNHSYRAEIKVQTNFHVTMLNVCVIRYKPRPSRILVHDGTGSVHFISSCRRR